MAMTTARVIKQGDDQLVLIPPEFNLAGEEVDLVRQGELLIIRDKRPDVVPASDKPFGAELVEIVQSFSDDMIEAIVEMKRQDRGGT